MHTDFWCENLLENHFVARENIKMDFRDMGCKNGKWIELTHQDHVEWQTFVLAVLKFRVLLQEDLLVRWFLGLKYATLVQSFLCLIQVEDG
jgi:hypothetical protein